MNNTEISRSGQIYLRQKQGSILEQNRSQIQRVQFEDGRFIDYRYNLDNNLCFGIKSNEFCRMTNLYIPGFDKKDERRGTYKGKFDQLVQLIDEFMTQLRIFQAIFVVHSYGGLIVKNFAYFKSQKVEGLVQLASVPLTLWQGIKQSQLLSLPKDELDQIGPASLFSLFEIIQLLKIKISVPGKCSEIFSRFRKLNKKIPRLIAYSPNDNVILASTIEEEKDQFVLGENAIKRRIVNDISKHSQLDKQDVGSIYIFRFDDTSHSINHEKGNELGILIKHFIKQLDNTEISTKLPKL
ncbi:hypothetical protein ABPG72_009512 [Tetrahymena utriculariae]